MSDARKKARASGKRPIFGTILFLIGISIFFGGLISILSFSLTPILGLEVLDGSDLILKLSAFFSLIFGVIMIILGLWFMGILKLRS